jgi:hypothetical protein
MKKIKINKLLSLLVLAVFLLTGSLPVQATHREGYNRGPNRSADVQTDVSQDHDEMIEEGNDDENLKNKKWTGKKVKDKRRGMNKIAPGQFVSLFRIIQNSQLSVEQKQTFLELLLMMLTSPDTMRDDLRDQRDELQNDDEEDDEENDDYDDQDDSDKLTDEEIEMVESAVVEYYRDEDVEVLGVERDDNGYEAEVRRENGDEVEVELNNDFEIVEVEESDDEEDEVEDDAEVTDEEYEAAKDAVLDYLEDEENEDDAEVIEVEREGDGYEVEFLLSDGRAGEAELNEGFEVIDLEIEDGE